LGAVAVIVPWRPGCPHRQAAWAWVQARYAEHHPDWTVIEASAPAGPWVKAEAVIPAVAACRADVVVVADADVWCDGLARAVAAVAEGASWAVPHGRVCRLSMSATAGVLAGGWFSRDGLEQPPYRGVEGGGLVVLPRASALEIPLDARFVGWGGEDHSWGYALRTLLGRAWRGSAPLWHLWHLPQDRLSRRIGSAENDALHLRYAAAKRNPEAMRELTREVQWPTCDSS
jgi:hypothetical protein